MRWIRLNVYEMRIKFLHKKHIKLVGVFNENFCACSMKIISFWNGKWLLFSMKMSERSFYRWLMKFTSHGTKENLNENDGIALI